MRLTGERPMHGATPDSLLALHDAGYREVSTRLVPRPGHRSLVLDVGCGVGDETARLAGDDRLVLGADYNAETIQLATTTHGRDDLRFLAMDGSRLGIADGCVDWAVSSHIIEHFTNPVSHVAELARVLRDDGTAFVITPNAPADFENPFHVYLFDPVELRSMLTLFFEEVECLGLEGDDALHQDFAQRRASGERLLALDVMRLRHRMPRRWYVWAYEHVLPVVYRVLGRGRTGIGSGLGEEHLFVTANITETTPVLFAIARRPRTRVGEE